MKVRVLGCSGAIANGCRTTSFLIGDSILVDAGTGVGDLTLEEMRQIDHVFLTHSHMDHIAALPLMLDSVSPLRRSPVTVHALQATIEALQRHVFNDVIWPDFTRIPSAAAPYLSYCPIQTGQQVEAAGTCIEALPAVHTVPAVGYAARGDSGWWVFSGDTERNPAFWELVNGLDVAALVIETAFSNREQDLARRSLHLSPRSLAQELASIPPGAKPYPIYITHTKPSETGLIMKEIQAQQGEPGGISLAAEIHWLEAGQVMEV